MLRQENLIHGKPGYEILVRINWSWIKIPAAEILLIECAGNYLKIFTTTAKIPYLVRASLLQAEQLLCVDFFCRVHRSYLVGLNHIRYIDRDDVINLGVQNAPLSKLYAQTLYSRFVRLGLGSVPAPMNVKQGSDNYRIRNNK